MICLGQILFGRISDKWGQAQRMFYGNTPYTKNKKHFPIEVWVIKTIGSLLTFTLDLRNGRCDSLHRVDEEETRKINLFVFN